MQDQDAPSPEMTAEICACVSRLAATLKPSELTIPPQLLSLIPPRPPGYGRHRELFVRATGDAFDPIAPREHCLLGTGRCHADHPCAAHARWREVFDPVTAFFRDTMVAELLQPSGEVAEPATA